MYKVIGADGREYGPVSPEQLRQWIADGRANAQTMVLVEGSVDWKPLGSFPEFAEATVTKTLAGTPPSQPANVMFKPATCGMAITALVMGILSLVQCCSIIFGVLGIIFSCIAISQINKRPSELAGKNMAVAGLIMSIAGLVINVVLIVLYLGVILASMAAQR